MGRSIGVDLHRDCFTTAILAANGRCYMRDWKLKELDKFIETLGYDDKIAVEMTTNVRLFHDCIVYTSPSPRDRQKSRLPSSA